MWNVPQMARECSDRVSLCLSCEPVHYTLAGFYSARQTCVYGLLDLPSWIPRGPQRDLAHFLYLFQGWVNILRKSQNNLELGLQPETGTERKKWPQNNPKIYEVLMNEDARPFMKAALAAGTLAWGHSCLRVTGSIYSITSGRPA